MFYQGNEECKAPTNVDYDNNVTANNEIMSPTDRLILPYKSGKGLKIIKLLKNYVKILWPQNHTTQHVHICTKLGSTFDIKEQTKLVHKYDLTYLVKCLEN